MTDDMQREAFEHLMATGVEAIDRYNRCKTQEGIYIGDRIQARWEGWCSAIRHMREQNEQRDSHE